MACALPLDGPHGTMRTVAVGIMILACVQSMLQHRLAGPLYTAAMPRNRHVRHLHVRQTSCPSLATSTVRKYGEMGRPAAERPCKSASTSSPKSRPQTLTCIFQASDLHISLQYIMPRHPGHGMPCTMLFPHPLQIMRARTCAKTRGFPGNACHVQGQSMHLHQLRF